MEIHALMIEDDAEIAEMLSDYLAQYHIRIDNYEDPYTGLSALNVSAYDIIILDLSLPGMDGLEVCREIRSKSDIPIIISSARSDLEDKIMGLGFGADDYLPKPYSPKELYARIQSILRRYSKGSANHPESAPKEPFVLDEGGQQIIYQNAPLKLTRAEYEILSLLIERKEHVVSREDLIDSVPSIREESSKRSLDVLIGRIRQKIGENPRHPEILLSVRGIGYKLVTR